MDQTTIPLKDNLRQEIVDAAFLEDVTPSLIQEAEALWRPEALRLKNAALLRGLSEEDLPLQHDHWSWETKKRNSAPGSRFFGVYCDGKMQGMMKLSPGNTCQITEQNNDLLVYIDYIEIAPWNLRDLAVPPQYRGVGSFFIEAAIQFSEQVGTEGRIGLHSLEQSEQFYRYFERTPLQAKRFVEG